MRLLKISAVALAIQLIFPVLPASASPAETVAKMSRREKVGQLVMFSVRGQSLSSAERDVIKAQKLGGVIHFARNYSNRSQLTRLNTQINRAVRKGSGRGIGALISVDQEGGIVKRFPDMPPRYSAQRLGSIDDPALTFRQGRATGRELIETGVNINLAPVADLDLPPQHVMRSRSFGSNPPRVGRHVREFTRGMQNKKVAAAVKHFPGLGGATRNSDDGQSYVYRSKKQLRDADAVPFHHAIAVGARLMMLSHAMYMNDSGKKPASMSRYITTSRLRKEFNFRGVAISDALESVAWRFKGNTAKACKNTVKAGVDIALLSGDVYAALRCARQIRRAVGNGAISKARLDQAVTRVLKLKAWLGVYRPPSAGRKAAQPSPSSDEEARRPTRAWGWAAARAPYLLETTSFALR